MYASLFLNAIYYITLFVIPVALYFVVLAKNDGRSPYSNRDWFYLIKFFLAKSAIKAYQERHDRFSDQPNYLEQITEINSKKGSDNHFIYGVDQKGNSLSLRFVLKSELIAEVSLCLRLADKDAVYTFPGTEDAKLYSLTSYSWKVKDLHIEVLEPFHRLRITYNGLLRDIRKPENPAEHVQFHFIWRSSCAPIFIPRDLSRTLLADSVASEKWRDGDWISQLGDQEGYEQFGALGGFVQGDSFPDDLILNLPAYRTRLWGTCENFAVKRSIHVFVAGRSGVLFSLWAKSMRAGCSQFRYGSIILGNGKEYPIDRSDIRLKFLAPHGSIPATFVLHVRANNREYKCVIDPKHDHQLSITNRAHQGYRLISVPAECSLDSEQGHGLVNFWYSSRNLGNDANLALPRPLVCPVEGLPPGKTYVVNLESAEAKIVALTGGKGSSLALLSSLKSSDFQVPGGFVVTTDAFTDQLESNFRLRKSVSMLDDICCERTNGSLQFACTETVKLFTSEEIISEVAQAVINELKKISANSDGNMGDVRWAVRSSGISEDCEGLSAAGQNETFLGIRTPDDVISAVSGCWASLFTYQSVKYRHRHGLPVQSKMAVVVQRMVAADVAGVMFTCHPSTANPAHMVVTANYGLGESVVSGQSEPDTIILKRAWDDHLTIDSKILGSKHEVIKMSTTSSGTQTEQIEEASQLFCLDDRQALLLGKIGISLESILGSPRDIEWAFFRNQLYLLQARPVTSLNQWTDFELEHEMDQAVLSDDALFTKANVGEVMPNALSVLSQSTVALAVDNSMQLAVWGEINRFNRRSIAVFRHHAFIDVILSIYRNPADPIPTSTKVLDLAVFGHPVIDDRINALSAQRHGGYMSSLQLLRQTLEMVQKAWKNDAHLRELKMKARNLKISIEKRDTTTEIFEKIDKYVWDFVHVIKLHCHVTTTSIFYQMLALNVLLQGQNEFTNEHYTDIANLLSSCNDIISAEVPAILEKITKTLCDHGKLEEFSKIRPDVAQEWLKINCSDAHNLFQDFLREHGHRTLGEFDLINVPWGTDPTQVVKVLQASTARDHQDRHASDNKTSLKQKTSKSVDQIVNELISFRSEFGRRILKWLMGKCRKAIGMREQSKSEIVWMVDRLRTAYGTLARRMVRDGLLPEENLIFHLAQSEIGEILEGSVRSSIFITKAFRRQKFYPNWNKLVFPELSYGLPVPESQDEISHPRATGDIVVCRGTPVYSGTVKARACVILRLDEIDQLQNGDILITHSTDIGWSPYFPMLSGIVTELGGLVSHGAVVAREYGLTSIVGAKGATKMFKTGDVVLLSGKTGTLELVV